MKEILLHTEDRENSDAMFKEVGGREARESHLSWVEAKKAAMVTYGRKEGTGRHIWHQEGDKHSERENSHLLPPYSIFPNPLLKKNSVLLLFPSSIASRTISEWVV